MYSELGLVSRSYFFCALGVLFVGVVGGATGAGDDVFSVGVAVGFYFFGIYSVLLIPRFLPYSYVLNLVLYSVLG